jgi:precorrin-8X/cobalt-precorrin-8 methylmutase
MRRDLEPAADMRQLTALGRQIESESFDIIDREVGPHDRPPGEWDVVRRVIHASADFEMARLVRVHPRAIAAGVAALRAGRPLVVDVKMIAVGVSEERLRVAGTAVHCFISDDDVIAAAQASGGTRAAEAMRKAHRLGLLDGGIVAVGNAPTALLELVRLCHETEVRPALVVGVPVGFVSAAESKAALWAAGQVLDVPGVIVEGRKGGSPIAVAVLHALLAQTRAAEAAGAAGGGREGRA